MKLNPGFYENMPFDEYVTINAINYSTLKYIEKSPMAFKHFRDNPPEPTAPMIIGNHVHKAILEPDQFKFAVYPGPVRRGRAFDDFCEEHAGKAILNQSEADHIFGMAAAVHANPIAHKYLRHTKTEVTMVWRDPSFKRDFKARIDAITDIADETFMVSLKSTVDCRDFRFASQYAQMSYHAQDAIYGNGYFQLTGMLPPTVTIAVEKLPPYETAVYRIPNEVTRQGQQQASKWLERLAECELTNKWPPAVEGEQDLVLPAWAMEGDFQMDDLEPIEK